MTVTDGGACIESVADSNNRYYNNFDCDMKVLGAGRLILHRFETEGWWDRLYVNPGYTGNWRDPNNYNNGYRNCVGSCYDGGNGPSNVQVNQNDIIRFTTDGSVIRTGFKICLPFPVCSNTIGTGKNSNICKCGTDPCQPQNFCVASASTRCSVCNPRYRKASSSSTSCTRCTAGYYQNEYSSSTSCKTCPVGKYNDVTSGSIVCKNCPAGTWNDATSRTQLSHCKNCLAGKYGTTAGLSACVDCGLGKWSTTPIATSASTCTACTFGKWSNTPGLGTNSCKLCQAGTYNDEYGRTQQCASCQTGRYQDQTGQRACIQCSPGKNNLQFRSVTANACSDCAIGKYNDLQGLGSACAVCLNNAEAGMKTCEGCKPGKYKSSNNICVVCSAGFYSDVIDMVSCNFCPKGYYAKNFALITEVVRQRHDSCSSW